MGCMESVDYSNPEHTDCSERTTPAHRDGREDPQSVSAADSRYQECV